MLKEKLLEAIGFVEREVLSDVVKIDNAYVYSARTVSVYHYTVDEGDHDIHYYILVTAVTDSKAGDCVLVTLERADTGQSVSSVGPYADLIDRIL